MEAIPVASFDNIPQKTLIYWYLPYNAEVAYTTQVQTILCGVSIVPVM